MKRRSFLQSLGAGIAALFVPAVAKAGDAVDAVFHGKPLASEFVPVGRSIWVSSTTAMFSRYGKGTYNYPVATIQEAIKLANHGDVIVVKSLHSEGRARINFS